MPDGDEYFEKGVTLMRAVLGDAAADAVLARHEAAVADGTSEQADFAVRTTWGMLCHRPQATLRDRALVMLACDIQLVRPLAMRDHARLALYAGVTREEINELLFHLTQYCGFPTTREAGDVIRALWRELDEEGARQPATGNGGDK
jgi:4-carboxymuconolactone decarboxylase